ncbi:hypothetical protein BAE44_0021931 [Dichanthelium oligosanthes]|uniref:tRNA pseudouridine synthase n=1 Tax=Dichanthelium oligosanthes TaxID=888268 RepID=A0A1E5UVX7_9POAL|nr:hypothetical protein BAE44_0021931 [Dichanthelium oligosanthes]
MAAAEAETAAALRAEVAALRTRVQVRNPSRSCDLCSLSPPYCFEGLFSSFFLKKCWVGCGQELERENQRLAKDRVGSVAVASSCLYVNNLEAGHDGKFLQDNSLEKDLSSLFDHTVICTENEIQCNRNVEGNGLPDDSSKRTKRTEIDYVKVLNRILPRDIRVLGWCPVPADFHARFNNDELCSMTIKGTAFLWHQVRCMVAVLFLIGQGLESPSVVDSLLDITKTPRKPQYKMAAELPLILRSCLFDNADFMCSSDASRSLTEHLNDEYLHYMLQAEIFHEALSCLPFPESNSLETLQKKRNHIPLLSRQTEPSYEERIAKVKTKLTDNL